MPETIHLQIGKNSFSLTNTLATFNVAVEAIGEGDIRAPLHGTVTEIFANVGDVVAQGTRLAVVEAMKMQHDVLADRTGTVTEVFASVGEQIAASAPLMKIGD